MPPHFRSNLFEAMQQARRAIPASYRRYTADTPAAKEEFAYGSCRMEGTRQIRLIAIPVKLYRTAKAEKISFRQLYKTTGARIRQQLYTDTEFEVPIR
jgi:hypothetical protein